MSETKPSQAAVRPEEKPTMAMPPPPAWAIALSEKVSNGFQAVETRLSTIEGNQTLTSGQVLDIGKRITAAEARIGGIEERQNTNSLRVAQPSEHDLQAKTEIAAEREARMRLEEKVDQFLSAAKALEALTKKPIVQKLGTAAVGVALLALAAIGAKLQAQVSHLESKPETVQAAPTVYVPVPTPMAVLADAGAK